MAKAFKEFNSNNTGVPSLEYPIMSKLAPNLYIQPMFKILDSKNLQNRKKLYRFRNCNVNQSFRTLRSPQNIKSLKSVTKVRIDETEIIKHPKNKKYYFHQLRNFHKARNFDLNLCLNWNRDMTGLKLNQQWNGIERVFKKMNPKKLGIHTTHNFYINFPLQNSFWWETILPFISFLKNLESICLYFDTADYSWRKFKDPVESSKFSDGLRRLAKLKEITLIRPEEAITDFKPIYTNLFSASNSLEKVNITISKQDIKPIVYECLIKAVSLKQMNFQGNLEIDEFVSLITAHPMVTEIGFIGFWTHSIMPKSKSQVSNCKNLENITNLCLDAGMQINTELDKKFYLAFLTAFVNLTTLKIDMKWAKGIKFIDEYVTTLTSYKKLKNLSIAISFTSLDCMADFFKKMKQITALENFTIAADIAFPRNIAKKLPDAITSFKEFLYCQSSLKSVEMYWYKIGILYLKEICQIMVELSKNSHLGRIKLAFGTNSDKYIALHDTMISELRKTIKEFPGLEEVIFDIVCQECRYFGFFRFRSACLNTLIRNASLGCYPFWTNLPFSFAWA